MLDSIELELNALHAAKLSYLAPSHLFNYFKEELNDKILINLVNELDNLIETIDTNNSFKILSLNDDNQENTIDSSQNSSLSSSLSERTINSCKLLLAEISNKLSDIFGKYNKDIKNLLDLFDRQQQMQINDIIENSKSSSSISSSSSSSLISFASRQDLLAYQRAILVQKLSTKHYDLLNLLFRNVFDFYQKFNQPKEEDTGDEADQEEREDEEESNQDKNLCENGKEELNEHKNNLLKYNKQNKNLLIENFETINRIM